MYVLMATRHFECVIYYVRSLEWKRTTALRLRCECNVGDRERLEMRVVCRWFGFFPAYIHLFIYFAPCTCHIGHFSIVVLLFYFPFFFVFAFDGKRCSYANWKQNWFMNDRLCCCCPSNWRRFVIFIRFPIFRSVIWTVKTILFPVLCHPHTQLLHSVLKSRRCCNYYLHFSVHSCLSGWEWAELHPFDLSLSLSRSASVHAWHTIRRHMFKLMKATRKNKKQVKW